MTTVVNELGYPPQNVTDALIGLQNACLGWKPTPVVIQDDPPVLAHPAPPNWHAAATESVACQFIKDPNGFVAHELYIVGVELSILLLMVVGLVWGFRLHRLPSAVFKIGRHILHKATAQ